MTTATFTSRGRITIPKDVRIRLGLQTGDRIYLRLDPDGALRLFPPAATASEVYGVRRSKTKVKSKAR